MSLSIRLQRHGSNGNPHYRLVVAERAIRRNGKYVELLGNYAPREAASTGRYLNLDLARIDYWVSKGAELSDTAVGLVKLARKQAPVAAKVA